MFEVNAPFFELLDENFFAQTTRIFEKFLFLVVGIHVGIIETDFMVSCNNDFMLELKLFENFKKFEKIFFPSILGEVSGMNENITLFFLYYLVQDIKIFMGVGYC